MTRPGIAILGLAAVLAGCADGGEPGAVPTPSPSPVAAVLETMATIPRGEKGAYHLSLWQDHLAWTEAPAPGQAPVSVVVYDLATRTVGGVPRGTNTGELDPAVGGLTDSQSLLFTKFDHPLDGIDGVGGWKLALINLRTDVRRTVAFADVGSPNQPAPFPSAQGHWAAWTEYNPPTGHLQLISFDLAKFKRRVLAPEVAISSVSIEDGLVYFDHANREGKVDVYRVPADGSAPAGPITHSGRVALPVAGNGWLAWQEPAGSSATSEWLQDLSRPYAPQRLASAKGGNPQPGRGFAVYLGNTGELLAGNGDGVDRLISAHVDIAARWAVFGDLVAWGERDIKSGELVIKVARLRMPPPPPPPPSSSPGSPSPG